MRRVCTSHSCVEINNKTHCLFSNLCHDMLCSLVLRYIVLQYCIYYLINNRIEIFLHKPKRLQLSKIRNSTIFNKKNKAKNLNMHTYYKICAYLNTLTLKIEKTASKTIENQPNLNVKILFQWHFVYIFLN